MSGRERSGRFTAGNRAAAGRGPYLNGRRFARWARELFEDPKRRERLVARIDREIDGDGPTPMVAKLLDLGFGPPAAIAQAEITVRVERLAAIVGVPVEVLLAEAARLSAAADGGNDA